MDHLINWLQNKSSIVYASALEQQTISIVKAGIHAMVNARTVAVAAAKSIRRRYD
jgi:DNA replicative helicase MCM subunit Mcm2 (Cdc46/Mcm family)